MDVLVIDELLNSNTKPILSICITLKNRSYNVVKKNNQIIKLKLFQECFRSILDNVKSIEEYNFEIIISDWNSKDIDVKEWVSKTLDEYGCRNLITKVITINREGFSRGHGLTVSSRRTTGQYIFFLDADMLLKKGFLFSIVDMIEDNVLSEKAAYAPMCFYITDPYNSKKGKWSSGFGNIVINKKIFKKHIKSIKDIGVHGWEDYYLLQDLLNLNSLILREKRKDFIHQWHPADKNWVWRNKYRNVTVRDAKKEYNFHRKNLNVNNILLNKKIKKIDRAKRRVELSLMESYVVFRNYIRNKKVYIVDKDIIKIPEEKAGVVVIGLKDADDRRRDSNLKLNVIYVSSNYKLNIDSHIRRKKVFQWVVGLQPMVRKYRDKNVKLQKLLRSKARYSEIKCRVLKPNDIHEKVKCLDPFSIMISDILQFEIEELHIVGFNKDYAVKLDFVKSLVKDKGFKIFFHPAK